MSLSLKIESIFSTVTALDKMQYKFKNRAVLEMLEKLVIVMSNQLVYYLIIEVSYAKSLLITKLMFINIKFEVFRKISYAYDISTKTRKETRSS